MTTAATDHGSESPLLGPGTQSGLTPAFVFGRSELVHVFLDGKGFIQWEIKGDELTTVQSRVHHRFDTLKIRIKRCVREDKQDMFKDHMGQALFHALCESDETRALSYFDAVERDAEQEALHDARFKYLGAGSVVAAILIAAAVAAAWQFVSRSTGYDLSIAIAAGVAGAWASVLQRVWKVELAVTETPRQVMMQGATRIVLGALFSAAALAAIKSGLLLPEASKGIWSLGLATFAAGFSERLVPELIAKMEAARQVVVT